MSTAIYTGINAVITYGGVVVSNDYTELTLEYTIKVEEKTAGNEVDYSANTTTKEGKWTLKIFDIAENGVALQTALKIGQAANLLVYDKGIITGKPIEGFPAIVTSWKQTTNRAKNVELEIGGIKNGAMLYDVAALQ